MRTFAAALILFLSASAAAVATPPQEALPDPTQEARAQSLFEEFRCLVCQNQSIAESRADLARDLRMLVRERIVAGDSDAAIRDYLTARYGDFVLLKPPVKPSTWLLWFGPLLLLLAGAAGVTLYFRSRRGKLATGGYVAGAAAGGPLTAAERERLKRLVDEAEADRQSHIDRHAGQSGGGSDGIL